MFDLHSDFALVLCMNIVRRTLLRRLRTSSHELVDILSIRSLHGFVCYSAGEHCFNGLERSVCRLWVEEVDDWDPEEVETRKEKVRSIL